MAPQPHPDDGSNSATQLEPAPSTSRFVEASGLELNYLDYGTEGLPPMLCIHGGAAHGHWFDFVAPGFTAHYHVRALDLRGHGDSDWPQPRAYSFETYAKDLAEVVERLDLRDFVLIGHSMGGMVSLHYAALYPGRVGKLVVVDTRMHMRPERVTAMRETGARPPKSYATQAELVARYRLEPAGTQMAAPEVIRHMALHSGRQQPDGTWRHKFDRSVYANFERVDGVPLWEKVRIPALLVRGEKSTRLGAEEFAAIRARAPLAQLAEVPASDHHIPLDNPAGFVDAVKAFLDRS